MLDSRHTENCPLNIMLEEFERRHLDLNELRTETGNVMRKDRRTRPK